MTNTISDFYPRLAALPEIVNLITDSISHNGAAILQNMKAGSDLYDDADEVNELITGFILDHAEEIKTYKGHGAKGDSSRKAIAYFEAHHTQAADLLKAQAAELEELLGKDRAAVALGQAREPFTISVLRWRSIYVVAADEFEDEWFSSENEAVGFARSNYQPFIENYFKR